MAIKLQVRRGTAANWSAAGVGNVVILLSGEIGYETDTGNYKIGDGATVWNNLRYAFPYVTGTASADTTTLSVDQTNDRVGIGTSSPLSQLHVESTAPVLRFRDSGAAASTHSLISADNLDGTLTISADAGNNTGTSNVSKIQFVVDGTTTSTVLPNAVGIGTASPAAGLHIESATPEIRLRDTDGPAGAYSQITSNNVDGSITIAADPGASGTGASSVSLSVDGTTRVQATTTGATVTGTCTATTFSGSGASLTSNTVPYAALANLTAAGFLGRNASGAVSEVSVASARTILGLGSMYDQTSTDYARVDGTNQIGTINIIQADAPTISGQPGAISQTVSGAWANPNVGGLSSRVRPASGTWSALVIETFATSTSTQLITGITLGSSTLDIGGSGNPSRICLVAIRTA
jgi:hypothetical protein